MVQGVDAPLFRCATQLYVQRRHVELRVVDNCREGVRDVQAHRAPRVTGGPSGHPLYTPQEALLSVPAEAAKCSGELDEIRDHALGRTAVDRPDVDGGGFCGRDLTPEERLELDDQRTGREDGVLTFVRLPGMGRLPAHLYDERVGGGHRHLWLQPHHARLQLRPDVKAEDRLYLRVLKRPGSYNLERSA